MFLKKSIFFFFFSLKHIARMVHYQLENDQPSQQSRDNHRLAAF